MVRGKQKLRLLFSVVVAAVIVVTLLQPALTTSVVTARVIVRGETLDAAKAAVSSCSGTVESEIRIIDAVVADVPETQIAALSEAPGITLVMRDREVEVSAQDAKSDGPVDTDLVHFTEAIGVDDVWAAGVLGQSVTVAVLDTGIDPTLSELRRTWGERGSQRFLAYYDAIEDKVYTHPHFLRSPRDPNGHGTHVAVSLAKRGPARTRMYCVALTGSLRIRIAMTSAFSISRCTPSRSRLTGPTPTTSL